MTIKRKWSFKKLFPKRDDKLNSTQDESVSDTDSLQRREIEWNEFETLLRERMDQPDSSARLDDRSTKSRFDDAASIAARTLSPTEDTVFNELSSYEDTATVAAVLAETAEEAESFRTPPRTKRTTFRDDPSVDCITTATPDRYFVRSPSMESSPHVDSAWDADESFYEDETTTAWTTYSSYYEDDSVESLDLLVQQFTCSERSGYWKWCTSCRI